MTEKITMIELFSGIGAQERALRQLDIPYEVTHTCDLDKDAVLSYAAMRTDFEKELNSYNFPSVEDMISELQNKNVGYDFMKGKHTITTRTSVNKLKQYYLADKLSKNLGDIGKLERLPYADMVTYSFPCTDLSVAGKGEGMQNKCSSCGHSWHIDFSSAEEVLICPNCGEKVSSSTRSGLLGQVQRLLAVACENNELPKYLLLENVKNLVGKKFVHQFNTWVKWLDSIGYNTYYQVLNAKHYGIPQNRERIFAVSIRKDVDHNEFKFPGKIPLTTRLKDVLEKNIDEKYYLPDDRIDKILNSTVMQNKKYDSQVGDAIKIIGNYMPSNHDASRVVDIDGIAPTVKENHGTVTAIAEPFIVASRGRNPDNPSDRTVGAPTEQRLEPNFSGCTNTLTSVQKDNYVAEPIVYDDYNSRISSDQDAINTLTTNCGASAERNGVKILEPIVCEERKDEGIRLFKDGCVGTLRTIDACGDKRVIEPEPKLVGGIGEKNFGKQYRQGNRVYDSNAIAMALNAQPVGNTGGYSYLYTVENESNNIKWRIRKLTPKECWRLMGFTDEEHDRAAQYVSASSLYKQAGNSICTCCLVAIFNALFLNDYTTSYAEKLVDYNKS